MTGSISQPDTSMTSIAKVYDLKRFVGKPNQVVELLGWRQPHDGGGGTFVWDDGCKLKANDGTIFAVSGRMWGRWRRIYSGPVDVRWFGGVDDVRVFRDARILSGSANLTFSGVTTSDVNKTVVLIGGAANHPSGTVSTVAGSRVLMGHGTSFEDDLWLGPDATIDINGESYHTSDDLSGVANCNTGYLLTGTGTQFTTELYVGAVIGLRSGTLHGSGIDGNTRHFRAQIDTIINDELATIRQSAPQNSDYMQLTLHGHGHQQNQSHMLLDRPATATVVSSSTWLGPRAPLVATITKVSGSTATLSSHADYDLDRTRGYVFTDNTNAFRVALSQSNSVVVSPPMQAGGFDRFMRTPGHFLDVAPGAFGLKDELFIANDQQNRHLHIQLGASLWQCDSIVVDASECKISGENVGAAVGNGEGIWHNFMPTNAYIGKPGRPIFRFGVTGDAYGSTVRGLRLIQLVSEPDFVTFGDAGTAGVTGLLLGGFAPDGVSGVGAGGVDMFDIVVSDTYQGINVRAATQAWNIHHFYILRHNNGWDNAFSNGFGIAVGSDSHYQMCGANTAGHIEHGIIQGFKVGIKIGGPGPRGPSVATTDIGPGKIVIENLPAKESIGVHLAWGGNLTVSGLHMEHGSEPDDSFSGRGIVISDPCTLAQDVYLYNNFLTGFNKSIDVYMMSGLVCEANYCDGSGGRIEGPSSDVNHPCHALGNLPNNVKRFGAWLVQKEPAGSQWSAVHELENEDGFVETHTWNLDAPAGVARPELHYRGAGVFDTLKSPNRDRLEISNGIRFIGDNDYYGLRSEGSSFVWTCPDGANPSFATSDGVNFALLQRYAASLERPVNAGGLIIRSNFLSGSTSQDIQTVFNTTIDPKKPEDATMNVSFDNKQVMRFDRHGNAWVGDNAQTSCYGDPNGQVTGKIGTVCIRKDPDGPNKTFYVKESGDGNTGWVSK